MNSKQECIAKAYGEYWESVKNFIDRDGWTQKKSLLLNFTHVLYDSKSVQTFNNSYKYRPKSLQGIEDNNGWIKIESEADLPKDNSINYHALNIEFPDDIEVCLRVEVDKRFTHYQPIEKPKPPLH